MRRSLFFTRNPLVLLALTVVVASCAVPPEAPKVEAGPPACTAAQPGDGLVGNWLAVRKQKGVAGELRTLFTLNADGTMAYAEQLKRPNRAPQGLSETGCWYRDGQSLVLRTYESNGLPVEFDDPIYINRYNIVDSSSKQLRLVTPDGATITAGQMSPGYRLPF